MKKIILAIILLLALNGVSATNIEYSPDNSTWENVTNIDEINQEAYQINLQQNSTAYFRARINSSYEWIYLQQTTKRVITGDDEMQAALVLAIGIITFMLLYFAFNLDQKHFLLKLMAIVTALVSIILLPNVFLNGVTETSKTFLNIPLWFFRLFMMYFMVYIFYHWAKRSEKFSRWLEKQK